MIPGGDGTGGVGLREAAEVEGLRLGELEDAVLVVGEVEVDVPAYELVAYDAAVELYFDTCVADVAEVAVVAACAHRLGYGDPEEEVGGLLVVEVDATVESVAEETKLYADVEVGSGLPGDFLVTEVAE